MPLNVIEFCHGRGRGFEPRRPRHKNQALTANGRFSRGHKKGPETNLRFVSFLLQFLKAEMVP